MNYHIPFERIIKFGQQNMLDRPLFNISWILGRFCNYKCSYCWPYARSDTLDFLSFQVYTNAVDSIIDQAAQNTFDQFHWSFSGGEPTAYKDLTNLMSYISKKPTMYQSVHLTTNLRPGLKWWDSWCSNTQVFNRKSITASFHGEFAKENEFAEKCLFLQDKGVFVTVNQVMEPSRFWETIDRCYRLQNLGINVTLKPQSNETASAIVPGYTEEMLTIMKTKFQQYNQAEPVYGVRLTDGTDNYYIDQAERFNSFGFNKFKGWTCNSGYQSVIIKGDEVKRGYSCHDTPLGTLTNGFELFKAAAPCITPTCISSADSKIPKCQNN